MCTFAKRIRNSCFANRFPPVWALGAAIIAKRHQVHTHKGERKESKQKVQTRTHAARCARRRLACKWPCCWCGDGRRFERPGNDEKWASERKTLDCMLLFSSLSRRRRCRESARTMRKGLPNIFCNNYFSRLTAYINVPSRLHFMVGTLSYQLSAGWMCQLSRGMSFIIRIVKRREYDMYVFRCTLDARRDCISHYARCARAARKPVSAARRGREC